MTIQSGAAAAATELGARLSPDRVLTPAASYDQVTAVPGPDHCFAPERVEAPLGAAGRYGRMFDLPALEVDEALLHQVGAAGGFSDAGDSRAKAGQPFGQYVAHDVTADRSPLRAHADVFALRTCARRGPTSSRSTAIVRLARRISIVATTPQSCSRTTETSRATKKALPSAATRATTPTSS
jgi:hypothetical protein